MAELAALLEVAQLVVASDSLPLHLANALGTPVLGLYGPKDEAVTGPAFDRALVVRADVACSPCTLRRCRIGSAWSGWAPSAWPRGRAAARGAAVSAPASRWRALLEERRAQKLDDDTLRAELAGAASRTRARGRCGAAAAGGRAADLPVHELLAGAAGSADPLRAVINAARLVALAERPACTVGAAELAVFLGASQHMATCCSRGRS